MARVLLTAAPWTYRQIRFADGQDSAKEFLGKHLFKRESTINGKMPFWSLLGRTPQGSSDRSKVASERFGLDLGGALGTLLGDFLESGKLDDIP